MRNAIQSIERPSPSQPSNSNRQANPHPVEPSSCITTNPQWALQPVLCHCTDAPGLGPCGAAVDVTAAAAAPAAAPAPAPAGRASWTNVTATMLCHPPSASALYVHQGCRWCLLHRGPSTGFLGCCCCCCFAGQDSLCDPCQQQKELESWAAPAAAAAWPGTSGRSPDAVLSGCTICGDCVALVMTAPQAWQSVEHRCLSIWHHWGLQLQQVLLRLLVLRRVLLRLLVLVLVLRLVLLLLLSQLG